MVLLEQLIVIQHSCKYMCSSLRVTDQVLYSYNSHWCIQGLKLIKLLLRNCVGASVKPFVLKEGSSSG